MTQTISTPDDFFDANAEKCRIPMRRERNILELEKENNLVTENTELFHQN